MLKDFISLHDINLFDFHEILKQAAEIKKHPSRYRTKLKNRVLAMIFQKPSLRTRVTFDAGILQMGGHSIYLSPGDGQVGLRESFYDVGKNLERWVDGIMIRTFAHKNCLDLAEAASIPVINGLSDLSHPCQAMADFLTIKEHKRTLSGLKLAWVGDGNNVCHSLMLAAARAGMTMAVATPPGYEPDPQMVKWALEDGAGTGFKLELTHDPRLAVSEADAVYTDVWASMGQESEKEERAGIFSPYRVDKELMACGRPDTLFMHCLPAHRGEEVTDEVIDSPNSVVFDQAENRLHAQKAIMLSLMGKHEKQ